MFERVAKHMIKRKLQLIAIIIVLAWAASHPSQAASMASSIAMVIRGLPSIGQIVSDSIPPSP